MLLNIISKSTNAIILNLRYMSDERNIFALATYWFMGAQDAGIIPHSYTLAGVYKRRYMASSHQSYSNRSRNSKRINRKGDKKNE